MSSDRLEPDELDDLRVVTDSRELKAMFHPVRGTPARPPTRACATIGELGTAVERPPSSIAYHVGVLVDAGMLRVVRTRRVRAIDERYNGRTARVFYVGPIRPEQRSAITNSSAKPPPSRRRRTPPTNSERFAAMRGSLPSERRSSGRRCSRLHAGSAHCLGGATPPTPSSPASTPPTTHVCPTANERPNQNVGSGLRVPHLCDQSGLGSAESVRRSDSCRLPTPGRYLPRAERIDGAASPRPRPNARSCPSPAFGTPPTPLAA
jgi:hypothetical protein